MFINSVYNSIPHYNTISFSSTYRSTVGQEKVTNGEIVWNTTNIFRDDMCWDCLVRSMDYNFMDKDKVNVYNLACSDGSEPYTLAIELDKQIPRPRRNKFLPIIASDIDNTMIRMAQSRKINLDTNEVKIWLGNNNDYFDKISDFPEDVGDIISPMRTLQTYSPNAYLRYAVEFHHNDILSELSSIEDKGNSVVLCRNVWPYLTEEYIKNAIKMLNTKLKTGSLLVLGSFDQSFVKTLIEKTFENQGSNVFRKI